MLWHQTQQNYIYSQKQHKKYKQQQSYHSMNEIKCCLLSSHIIAQDSIFRTYFQFSFCQLGMKHIIWNATGDMVAEMIELLSKDGLD